MTQDIFVGLLCVVAAVAGVWCLWAERGRSSKKDKKEGPNKDDTKKR
ncbi:MAG: hypothetical protein IJ390_11700 [Lachnospiraceae bacterium]|nr:hypothetical protein [Lachnospiraceae bacterium]